MSDWWIVLTGLGFLALCVAFEAWRLNGPRHVEPGDSNGTHP
ncbi:hypothetical protein [Achromobacter piechaudii]|uniref:Uncharacterized protein n=1 Tax=Achromobacter piechaudii TaxID=72556 RepID=A0ABM8L521_9BURK|nr:hypothetical protein [Achromobacter piechaudii]CAB3728974.1 hypothetical protein LMG1873_04631 [Achromobacter piechaudii]